MRKEIKKEVEYLEKWATLFATLNSRKADTDMQYLHATALDARSALKGEAMTTHTDTTLIEGLTRMKGYIHILGEKGQFNSPTAYSAALKMCDSIITMLSVSQQMNQKELF